jgi:hypothetical protein
MRPLLLLALLTATLTPVLSQQATYPPPPIDAEPDFIFIQEINLWKTLQSHNLAAFQAFLLPDFLDIEKTIQTRDQIMENLNTCTLASFSFHNHKVRMLSPDNAVIAYNADSDTTCGDSHLKGAYNATTTWVRRDGKWLVQLHTEAPIRP